MRSCAPSPSSASTRSPRPTGCSPNWHAARRLRAMPIERVFVAGAGLMGHGIGQVHAAVGCTVDLYEPELARAVAGKVRIAASLDRAVAKGKLAAAERDALLARVSATDDVAAAAQADL